MTSIKEVLVREKAVVVIDVLRATSVMITALAHGASEIIPVETQQEARLVSKEFPGALLCGERNGIRIEGFDLGNSPAEYAKERVGGRSLIMTTSNGTRAIRACRDASSLLIGAFLNLETLSRRVADFDELTIVCAGTHDRFSMDDALCAALLIRHLKSITGVTADDLGNFLLNTVSAERNLRRQLQECKHLHYLIHLGYEADVEYCLQLNTHKIVPEYVDGRLQV